MAQRSPLRRPRRGYSRVALPAALLTLLLVPALWIALRIPPRHSRVPALGKPRAVCAGETGLRLADATELKHRGWASFVRFSPTGRYLGTGAEDGTVRIWTSEGRKVRVIRTRHNWLDPVAFDPTETLIAAGADNGMIHVWSLADGQERAALSGHDTYLERLTWSLDGKVLASLDRAGELRLWSMPDGEPLLQQTGVGDLLFRPDGNLQIAGDPGPAESSSDAPALFPMDVDTFRPSGVRLPAGLTASITGAPTQILEDATGHRIACATESHEVRVWDRLQDRPILKIDLQRPPSTALVDLESIAFSPDGKTFAAASLGSSVYLWRLPDPKEPRTK